MHEPSDFLPYVILRIADITAEITLHVFGFFAFIVRQIRYFTLHGHHTVALPSRLYVYIDLTHHYGHARRSQTKHLFAVGTFHRFTVLHVVMPIAHDIKSRHLASYVQSRILRIVRRNDAALLAGMEQSDEYIRLLFLPNQGNPPLCTDTISSNSRPSHKAGGSQFGTAGVVIPITATFTPQRSNMQ